MNRIIGTVVALALVATTSPAPAQLFANKPVLHLIVPLPPGGGDLLARAIAEPLGKILDKTIVVENKPGADGEIAAEYVKRSKPDGNTIFFASNSPLCAVPALRKEPSYDPIKDFSPISLAGVAGFFLFVNSKVPAKTVGELISYAKAHPGKLNAGVSNSSSLFALAQLKNSAKVDIVDIRYAGDGKAISALVSGEVDLLFATVTSARGFVDAGTLKILATTLPKRSKFYPSVPTLDEEGVPGITISPWIAFFGPAGLPKDITEEYSAAINKALEMPSVRDRLESFAINVSGSTPEELAIILKDNLEVTKKAVADANIPKN